MVNTQKMKAISGWHTHPLPAHASGCLCSAEPAHSLLNVAFGSQQFSFHRGGQHPPTFSYTFHKHLLDTPVAPVPWQDLIPLLFYLDRGLWQSMTNSFENSRPANSLVYYINTHSVFTIQRLNVISNANSHYIFYISDHPNHARTL